MRVSEQMKMQNNDKMIIIVTSRSIIMGGAGTTGSYR
jgi:hypothetical protein